jgi:L-alanine-DL-glutamate epimerase-like enolase superfamily enzyme
MELFLYRSAGGNKEGMPLKITRLTVRDISVPLKNPFVTALRTVRHLHNILVTIHTDEGPVGLGEAAAAAAVTGDTPASAAEAVLRHIAPAIVGLDVMDIREISRRISGALYGNFAAKCAADSAIYDLFAKKYNAPLFRILGGSEISLAFENDITISADEPGKMLDECLSALNDGYRILKIKLGKTPAADRNTLISIWEVIRDYNIVKNIQLRVDANQGWETRNAIHTIRAWEDKGLPVAFVEQPVPAHDIHGLREIKRRTETPIAADECVFNARDALYVLENHAADIINVKLAKAGGISEAVKIKTLCDLYEKRCMVGSMLESRLGTAAAAHFAAAYGIKTVDLDGPLLLAGDPFTGGPVFEGSSIIFTANTGIGVRYPKDEADFDGKGGEDLKDRTILDGNDYKNVTGLGVVKGGEPV